MLTFYGVYHISYVAENSHKIPYTHEVRTCCHTYNYMQCKTLPKIMCVHTYKYVYGTVQLQLHTRVICHAWYHALFSVKRKFVTRESEYSHA